MQDKDSFISQAIHLNDTSTSTAPPPHFKPLDLFFFYDKRLFYCPTKGKYLSCKIKRPFSTVLSMMFDAAQVNIRMDQAERPILF